MEKHRQTALLYACLFLRDRNLRADPLLLLTFVDVWLLTCDGLDEELAKQCGIHAAKECASPVVPATIGESAWIEPGDLRD